jgi:hypothetical protein
MTVAGNSIACHYFGNLIFVYFFSLRSDINRAILKEGVHMKTHNPMTLFLLSLLVAIFAGCGSDSGQSNPTIAVAASQQCIACHSGNNVSISPVTGVRITDEWLRSPHNAVNGPGCPDCHIAAHIHQNTGNCLACHSTHDHPDTCGVCHGGSSKITSCLNCHTTPAPHTDPQKCNCSACHDASYQVKASVANPDVAGRCLGCHSALGAPHLSSNVSGTTHDAQFVDQQNLGNCRNCHNPHDNTVLPAAKAWEQSAHGDIHGPAWSDRDFKANTGCLRCHTASGYVSYVTGTPAFTLPTAPLAASPTYGVLGCNTCHKNYNFNNHTSVRKIPAYTAPYNSGLSPKTFPDVGDSNLCIPCHSGRESGDTINAITADFTNVSFVPPHNMAAAATMYMTNAFITYTTLTAPAPGSKDTESTKATFPNTPGSNTTTNAKTLLPAATGKGGVGAGGIAGGQTSTHRALGTTSINKSEVYLNGSYAVANNSINTNGPCVTCHMQADRPVDATGLAPALPAVRAGAGHSLKIDNDALTQLCVPCHSEVHLDGGDGKGNAVRTQLSKDTIPIVMIEPQSAAFQNGLTLIKQLLLIKYMIKFDPTADPYFFDLQKDATGKIPVTDWTRKNVAGVSNAAVIALGTSNVTVIPTGGLTQKQAQRLMGACFNLNLMVRDPGAFVHARTFSQRLVYDAVDYLDDNLMDFTALGTARVLNPTVYHGTNVNVFASDGTLATEPMAWLAGTHYSDKSSGNTLIELRLRP